MTFTILLSVISFAIATAFTPGPNNLMLLSSGLTFGYKRTLAHIVGVAVGFPIMVLAMGLGVGAVLEHYPMVYVVLKVLGFGYLLWMAWHIANTQGSIQSDNYKNDKPFTFLQAALFQWVNPKAWIMAVTAISSFTTQSSDVWYQIAIIAFVYLVVGIFSTHSWALGGVLLQRWLESQRAIRNFNRVMALLIVVSVVPFMFG